MLFSNFTGKCFPRQRDQVAFEPRFNKSLHSSEVECWEAFTRKRETVVIIQGR